MPRKILIADDEKSILKLYTRIFTGKEYSLTTAESFAEASGLIEANHYDLLVTDLLFADGLGTGLIKLFEEKYEGAKSMLVTGAHNAEELLADSGITQYYPKPFDVRCFMAGVTKALNA